MYSFKWEYTFDSASYEPGGLAKIRVAVSNTGPVPIQIDKMVMRTAFGSYSLEVRKVVVGVGRRENVGSIDAILPSDQLGRFLWSMEMTVNFHHEGQWQGWFAETWTDMDVLTLSPREILPVFVSRGVRPEDRAISDPLVEILQAWGLETRTVGVEIHVPPAQVPDRVRQEVLAAPGLILIATPRSLDAITNGWKTFEWAHAELGMAYAQNRPILVLCAEGVEPAGLPGYLKQLGQVKWIKFNSGNPTSVRAELYASMLWYRHNVRLCIKKMRSERLWEGVKGFLAVVGGVATVAVAANAISGDDEDYGEEE